MFSSSFLFHIGSVLIAALSVIAIHRLLLVSSPRTTKMYDITVPFSADMVAFDGDDGIGSGWMTQLSNVEFGDDFTTSMITLNSHYGTHVDAFKHIAPRGSVHDHRDEGVGDDIDSLDLYTLLGEVLVVDVGDVPVIDAGVLRDVGIPPSAERVLFKTRNSRKGLMHATAFDETYVALDDSGADFVVASTGLKLVGIDYLSIVNFAHLKDGHQTLLGNGCIAIEGLDLAGVDPGTYELVCLPLRYPGGDGSPIRCVLRWS